MSREWVITFPAWRPKQRPRGKNFYTPSATRDAEDEVRAIALASVGKLLLVGPLGCKLMVGREIPKSWSEIARQNALGGVCRPIEKPDADNLAKLMDALNGILWVDDAQIVDLRVEKHYSENPETIMILWQI